MDSSLIQVRSFFSELRAPLTFQSTRTSIRTTSTGLAAPTKQWTHPLCCKKWTQGNTEQWRISRYAQATNHAHFRRISICLSKLLRRSTLKILYLTMPQPKFSRTLRNISTGPAHLCGLQAQHLNLRTNRILRPSGQPELRASCRCTTRNEQ
jgi:hypothetical protein